MAAQSTSGFPLPVTAPMAATPGVVQNRRRRITPRAGQALEILGHSIEYLMDEYVHCGGEILGVDSGQVDAIQMLMEINRKIYFECPTVPTFAERCQALLGSRVF